MKRIAINGFGRIGRTFLRTILTDKQAQQQLDVVAINCGPTGYDSIGHFFKYDTLMGTFPDAIRVADNILTIGDKRIQLMAQADPAKIDWKALSIDWVVESSGHFTKRDDAAKHIQAGAARVLLTAPAHGDDVTIIPGVNNADYNSAKDYIVSLGSCTTNAFAPLLKIMDDAFGIQSCFMTTVHAYTNTQALLDNQMADLRRGRAAALNIIPASTGASSMVKRIFPHLADVVQAQGLRVPVGKVSILDLVLHTKKQLTVQQIHDAATAAADGSMRGIVAFTQEQLVSSDFGGNPHSVIIDGTLTQAIGSMAKVWGWYDNEWAYSCRLRDFLVDIA